MVIKTLKKILSDAQIKNLRIWQKNILSLSANSNLNKLALIWGSDKWGAHWYTQHYDYHFKHIRNEKLNVLEIGIGGYDDIMQGGKSLLTWKAYFKKSKIFGIDLYDKSFLNDGRITTFKGSQIDKVFLNDVCNSIGNIDIIIDDGSHVNAHIIESFLFLFPKLNQNGIYVVEDLETSYHPEYGGDSKNLKNPYTAINFFKTMVDCLNHSEIIDSNFSPSYFDLNIIGIHFYHNMVFIQKGSNNEKSVNIVDNKRHRLDSVE
jgi:hypothetical protein